MNPTSLVRWHPRFLQAAASSILLILASVIGAPAVAAAPRTGEESAAEQQFLSLANSARSQSALAPLAGSSGWQGHARDHSDEMAASNSIFHDSNLSNEAASLGCWTKVGENVGRGPSVGAIHNGLMNSPTHRANILGDFDALGVGVKISAEGTVYVTQRFLKSCGAPAPAPAPALLAPPPAPAPPAPVPVAAPVPATKPAPVAPKAAVASNRPTVAAPASTPLEPSKSVKQEQHGGSFIFDIGI